MTKRDEVTYSVGEQVWVLVGTQRSRKGTITQCDQIAPDRWAYSVDSGPLRHRESGLKKLYKAA